MVCISSEVKSKVALRYTHSRFEAVGNTTEATSIPRYGNSFCNSSKPTSIHMVLKIIANVFVNQLEYT